MVAGGAGFVGSAIVRELLREGALSSATIIISTDIPLTSPASPVLLPSFMAT